MALPLAEMFEFAAPPRTGVSWFVRACREAGLGMFGQKRFSEELSIGASFLQWLPHAERPRLRVSIVRHPCDWLKSIYEVLQTGKTEVRLGDGLAFRYFCAYGFGGQHEISFDDFVIRYLDERSGLIGDIFNSYQSDVRMRLGDMPWGFVELLESFDVKQTVLDRVANVPIQGRIPLQIKWDPVLRRRLIESEAEFCQSLDYY